MSDKEYFTTTDPEGREITLHESTWKHIKDGHPEIRSPNEVKSIIQKPHVITDIKKRKSVAHTKISHSNLYINVYTKMADTGKTGRVSTTFLQSKMPEGEVIWVESK